MKKAGEMLILLCLIAGMITCNKSPTEFEPTPVTPPQLVDYWPM
jgi:hypothetical protein